MITATHLHAMIIHFPIALLMAGFFSEVLSLFIKKEFFSQTALYLLVLGTLGAIVAYLTGRSAGEGIEEGPLKISMDLHEQAATITLWLAIITASYRVVITIFKYKNSFAKWTGFFLFALLIGAVTRTGYLGGQLVYKHGAGVEIGLPDFGNQPDEKPEKE